ncbi:DUF58 domain-containing protein [Aquisphaera insulae]|uniref:DUF58 domain-containing protein n=1 Tax=Aquisphaera insulae TaxID=2712864 RepID=UPI0013EB605C|nr:DUF58 domain-containing protein [Aquisphaera insulae]
MNIFLINMRTHVPSIVRAAIPAIGRGLGTTLGCLGLVGLASLLCGLFLHPRGLVAAAGAAGVAAIGTAWPWLSIRGLSASIEFDRRRGREGEAATFRLRIRNRLPWGVWGLSVVGDFGSAKGSGPVVSLPRVKARDTAEIRADFVPSMRGEYPSGVPRLACGFPFGLWEASRPIEVRGRLLVWPRTYPVGLAIEAAGGTDGRGLSPRDRAGGRGDLMGVRPYRRGEPIGRIHWGQTARRAELIVCEACSTAAPRIRIDLDPRREVHAGEGSVGSREWAIRVAASLAERGALLGADVSLACGGRTIVATADAGRSGQVALLDALARLQLDAGPRLAESQARSHRLAPNEACIRITTDLGLLRPARDASPSRGDLWVVLSTRGFDPTIDLGPEAHDVSPWLWIEGPERVASSLRGARGVAGHAR